MEIEPVKPNSFTLPTPFYVEGLKAEFWQDEVDLTGDLSHGGTSSVYLSWNGCQTIERNESEVFGIWTKGFQSDANLTVYFPLVRWDKEVERFIAMPLKPGGIPYLLYTAPLDSADCPIRFLSGEVSCPPSSC